MTVANHHQALALANTIRLARAKRKHEIRALDKREGLLQAARCIEDPPRECQKMLPAELLGTIHRWGNWQAERALRVCKVNLGTTIGGLTDRQRLALSLYLRSRA